ELLWHEALDDRDFLIFLLGKLGAARLFINARGFAALLHHARQDFKDFSVTHTCIPPVCASSNIAILHGSLNETQRTDAALVLGFGRLDKTLLDGITQAHAHGFDLQQNGARRPRLMGRATHGPGIARTLKQSPERRNPASDRHAYRKHMILMEFFQPKPA